MRAPSVSTGDATLRSRQLALLRQFAELAGQIVASIASTPTEPELRKQAGQAADMLTESGRKLAEHTSAGRPDAV